MKKDAFYFPHFCNTQDNSKLRKVMRDFKHEGYSVYYQILEKLRHQEGFKYKLEDLFFLEEDLKTTELIINSIIHSYDLFENDGVYFWSNDLTEAMQPYLKRKEQRVLAGKKSAEARRKKAQKKQLSLEHTSNDRSTTVQRPINDSSNDRSTTVQQSKVKKSKVKESKVDREMVKNNATLEGLTFSYRQNVGSPIELNIKGVEEEFPKAIEGLQLAMNRKYKMQDKIIFYEWLELFMEERSGFMFNDHNHVLSSLRLFFEGKGKDFKKQQEKKEIPKANERNWEFS